MTRVRSAEITLDHELATVYENSHRNGRIIAEGIGVRFDGVTATWEPGLITVRGPIDVRTDTNNEVVITKPQSGSRWL